MPRHKLGTFQQPTNETDATMTTTYDAYVYVGSSDYAQRSMDAHPLRSRGIRAVIRALRAAGDAVVSVHDGAEHVSVSGEREALTVVHGVDEATLTTASGAGVFLVMCNGDDVCDTIADWSASIDAIVSPVIDRHNV